MSFRLPSSRRVAAAIALVLAAACGDEGAVNPGSSTPSNPATETFASSLGVNLASMTKKSDNLYYQDIVVGNGATAGNGSILRVTYTGYLVNGTKFDSNVGSTTFAFRIGDHGVIDGWEQGLIGMRAGGKRKLVIGSVLGYGSRGSGPIPPNATLVFDVELVSVS